MKFGKNNCPHEIADIAERADGLCPLCQQREIEELKAADRDHMSATNGMRTRLNEEITQLRAQIEKGSQGIPRHGAYDARRGFLAQKFQHCRSCRLRRAAGTSDSSRPRRGLVRALFATLGTSGE